MSILLGILYTLLVLVSIFLICLVLIQRGKGGGLSGAFGGAGGSSAFGTKAGDVFTRVTMITAVIWILLNMCLVFLSNRANSSSWVDDSSPTSQSRPAAVPASTEGSSLAPGVPDNELKSILPSDLGLPLPGSPENPINPTTPPEPATPKSNP